MVACPAVGPAVKEHILQPALSLSTSALLQDNGIGALLNLFEQMIVNKTIEFEELLSLLQQQLSSKVQNRGIYKLSKSIAAITAKAPADKQQGVLDDIFKLLDGSPGPDEEKQVQLSLLITGDLGRVVDLNKNNIGDRLKTIYLQFFESSSDDLKNAAAYALGNAAVGSPVLLEAIMAKFGNEKQQYLLLSALREFIQSSARSGADISSHLDAIVPHLEASCAASEEGVRTMTADCLGALAFVHPDVILPKLVELQQKHSMISCTNGVIPSEDSASRANANVSVTIATAVKVAVYGKVDQEKLAVHMKSLVELLQQEEVGVRGAALLMIYSAVHHMPQTVAALLKSVIMPQLYVIAGTKLERKVDLGPFTHTVDDALPLRKTTLSIFATCLEELPSCLDMAELMPILAKAIGDAEDIQLHAHQVVISMAPRHPTYVVAAIDSFVDPLFKTLTKKAGQKTGTELERLNDWIKSALRVVMALKSVDGTLNSRKFSDFVDKVEAEKNFTAHLAAIAQEN